MPPRPPSASAATSRSRARSSELLTLFAGAAIAAFVALVLASQLPAPLWLWALDALALSLSVAGLSGVALVIARLGVGFRWRTLALAATGAAAALLCHPNLLEWLSPPDAVPQIDFWRLQGAALTVVGALFGLFGGIASLTGDGLWYDVAIAGAAVAAALFALGPLLVEVGVPVDHRAFLGLAGLGLGAWAVVEGARKVGRR